ncbi:MAG: bifunctional riboflavin kinase/FAD synthetase [Actinomycetota bacterium]|nr:bifunctional riboflavin kinase/FAD synthetase [Actinomycetota bacterium]MDP2288420.1 bifunctional riboflavin kinase/FAD synthetase [Actinomycetota bacterium]
MASERTSPSERKGAVLCIGVFDGVHKGHQALLAEGRALADELGLPLVAVTFDPHPLSVVRPDFAPTSLASLAERRFLLFNAGADDVFVLKFTQEVSGWEPEEFIHRVLADTLQAKAIVVGENFRFGHRAAGDVDTLREAGKRYGFVVSAVTMAADAEPWSSTRVRTAIAEGDMAEVRRVLGRNYELTGIVVHGDHRGRDLGFPTANLLWLGNPAIPADGVYAGWLVVRNQRFPAAISVGTNPQFSGDERRIESYVLDRDDLDLYDCEVTIVFVAHLRGQLVFDGLEGLIEQMNQDVAKTREVLNLL